MKKGLWIGIIITMVIGSISAKSDPKVLLDAVQKANIAEVKKQIKAGADVNAVFVDTASADKSKKPLLYFAIQSKNLELVKLLVKSGADINAVYEIKEPKRSLVIPLIFATVANVPMLDYFIDNVEDIGAGIQVTTEYGEFSMGILYIAYKTNQNIGIVKKLLKKGAPVDDFLLSACWNKNSALLKEILPLDFDANLDYVAECSDENLLLAAIGSLGDIEVIKLIIKKGIDVNFANASGYTALHSAAGLGNLEIVKLLIKNGADVNATDENGKTPLDYAKQNKKDKTVKYLQQVLKKGR